MKNTGIVRKLDELGRITLPMEMRKNFEMTDHTPLHIYVDGDKIILEKFEPGDIFTGETEHLYTYKGKSVSLKSIIEIAKLAGLQIELDKNNIDDDFRQN